MRSTSRILFAAGAALLLLASGCSETSPPTAPLPGAPDKAAGDAVMIGDYLVTYDGRDFDGQETTFHWTVAGTGVGEDMQWFFVELPDCAPVPVGYSPGDSVGYVTLADLALYGLKWHLGLPSDDTGGQPFSISFPGDVAEGTVGGVIGTASGRSVASIPGPCAGGFSLSGTVFTDANGNGDRDPDESGIADVIVTVASGGEADTARTDAAGHWSLVKGAGTYTVSVEATGPPDAFNATLADLFTATTATSREVTVGPDAGGLDFGYAPDTQQIIADLDQDMILANGEPVRWWRRQMHAALRVHDQQNDNPNRPVRFYDPQTLLRFLAEVQSLYLPEPFTFTPGQELEEAYGILRRHPRTDLEDLRRELLASELNHVSGRGLIGVQPGLQGVLIAWGETLVAQEEQAAAKASPDKASTLLQDAIVIFGAINSGGGGGIDE